MSTNGTFINGAKLGKGQTGVLRPGDHLGLSTAPAPAGNPAAAYVNTVE
jgi:hypothetical protein